MMNTANVLLALAARGLPHVIAIGSEHTHPPHVRLGRVWDLLRIHTYGRLSSVVTLNEKSAAWVRTHTRARAVHAIPNPIVVPLGIGYPELAPPRKAPGTHVLLAAGRLAAEKGFDMLLPVFGRLAPDYPSWSLWIVGQGPDRPLLERLVSELGLSARVLLPGNAGNIGQWYQTADLFVMTSRFEGFGNTLAEALAHGVPAVSFDCDTGPATIIRHGVDGVLVPAGDTQRLEIALRRLMDDEAERHRLAFAAPEARQRFSLEEIARQWERLFTTDSTRIDGNHTSGQQGPG
jgi:glycosyltransferase involved in cell wall biosynthesis